MFILFPLKILGCPAHWMLGKFGLVIAAIANAIICRQFLCWLAWNGSWTSVNSTMLGLTMAAGFLLTFFAVLDK